MELGYWHSKGLAEPIRWLIAYLKLEVHEYNPASAEEWFECKKKKMSSDFPNLPYLADPEKETITTESGAIPHYLVNKAKRPELMGKDLMGVTRVRQMEGVLGDMRQAIWKVTFGVGCPKLILTNLFSKQGIMTLRIKDFSEFLGNNEYLIGYLTYADILFAYMMELSTALCISLDFEDPLEPHSNLRSLCERVKSLPGISNVVSIREAVPFFPKIMVSFSFKNSKEVKEFLESKKQDRGTENSKSQIQEQTQETNSPK